MQEHAQRLAPGALTVDDELERDVEARLVESSTLAFRVAFSVTRTEKLRRTWRRRRSYGPTAHLPDRERFRAWLVRLTWRLAFDRQRAIGGAPLGSSVLGPPHRRRQTTAPRRRNAPPRCGRPSTPSHRSCGS